MRKIMYALASLAAVAMAVGAGWKPYCAADPTMRGAPGEARGRLASWALRPRKVIHHHR